MKGEVRYEASLRPKRSKFFKKKVILNRQIPVNREYSFKMSVWIPDTPGYHLRPSIVVTFQHNGEKWSISFNDITALVYAFGEMEHFISQKELMLNDIHRKAVEEWHTFHQLHTPTPLYDYTDTVIQGDREEEGQEGGIPVRRIGVKDEMYIDLDTGEIIERRTSNDGMDSPAPEAEEGVDGEAGGGRANQDNQGVPGREAV